MKTINGGSAVQGGYYLSKSNWEIFPIEKDGQKLPGASSEHYVKLNTAAALMLMPVLGGLMVVFLPFIGLYLTAKAALSPVAEHVQPLGPGPGRDCHAGLGAGRCPLHRQGDRGEEGRRAPGCRVQARGAGPGN